MHQDIDAVRTTHPIRTAITAATLAAGATLLLPSLAGAQDASTTTEPTSATSPAPVSALASQSLVSPSGHIKIEDNTAPSNAQCISAEQAFTGIPLVSEAAWTVYPNSTDDQFILKIIAPQPLCSPVSATAVTYNMPDGNTWPQTAGEQLTMTLQNAGEITVTFEKQCNRVQFDLLAGNGAPATINTGFDHQLLFPLRLDTALQYFSSASKCQPTTVAPTTTVPTSASPTTAAVLGQTTTIPADVLSATTVPGGVDSADVATRGASLAATGSNTAPMTVAGVAMVAVGGALVVSRRRKLVG